MFLDLIEQELGSGKDAGTQKHYCCPFCGEQKHKFYVNCTDSEKHGLWDCKKCGMYGNPLTFVKEYYEVETKEAIEILETFDYEMEMDARQEGLTEEEALFLYLSDIGKEKQQETNQVEQVKAPPFPENTKRLIENTTNPEAYPFFAYLKNRGVTWDQIVQHDIRYVTIGKTYTVDGRELTIRNHLVFPTHNDDGSVRYWNTRSIEKNPYLKTYNASSQPDEHSRKDSIFNLNHAKHEDKLVITEAVFDALSSTNAGVATFGKKPTDKQIQMIQEVVQEKHIPVYLFLDNDARREMKEWADKLLQEDANMDVYYVLNPYDGDANDLGSEIVQELIKNAIKADSFGDLLLTTG